MFNIYIVTLSTVKLVFVILVDKKKSTKQIQKTKFVVSVPRYPLYLLTRECDFSHDNLLLKWRPPVDTFVTRYEVRIDGKTYTTRNFFPMLQFTGHVFLPGWRYYVRIITVSGTDNVKKSMEYTQWITTISTSKNIIINGKTF